MATPPKWWDVTIPMDRMDTETLTNLLDNWGIDRYVIGLERGERGYRHFQCRIVFKEPKTLDEVRYVIPFGHWSPTSVRDMSYVEKEGNFIRSTERGLKKFAQMPFNDWEEQMVKALEQQNDREIWVLVDKKGKLGKSTFGRMLQARHMMEYITQEKDPEKYMYACYGKSTEYTKGFFFDINKCHPQGKYEANWQEVLFNTCETLKNQLVKDGRNTYKERWLLESPKILIVMNEYPETNHLSEDRLKIFEVRGKEPHRYLQWIE